MSIIELIRLVNLAKKENNLELAKQVLAVLIYKCVENFNEQVYLTFQAGKENTYYDLVTITINSYYSVAVPTNILNPSIAGKWKSCSKVKSQRKKEKSKKEIKKTLVKPKKNAPKKPVSIIKVERKRKIAQLEEKFKRQFPQADMLVNKYFITN